MGQRRCEVCGGPGPCLWADRGPNVQRYCCGECHPEPDGAFFRQAVELPRRYVMLELRSCVGNCALFWRHGRAGYTCSIDDAHVFTEEEAFSQHRCRPEVDLPIPIDVARSLIVRHVSREGLFAWCRDNQDPRRTDPYGAQPRKANDG